MLRYAIKRILSAIPLLLVISFMIFMVKCHLTEKFAGK